jgi:hypothetical protein
VVRRLGVGATGSGSTKTKKQIEGTDFLCDPWWWLAPNLSSMIPVDYRAPVSSTFGPVTFRATPIA